ncbi:MAG: transglutaminase domain-containing protein [Candidatus Aenigmatarchaeota archaeon]|nr:MAG: transglutaminase domain-containing protein [Candidatus Aenigmarchaeota archaeon]
MEWQKVILVLIIIILLAGLALELMYIEDTLLRLSLSEEEQCKRMCSGKGEVAYVVENSCYCKEPITFRKTWRCFWDVTFEEDMQFSPKFNSTSVRNIAVKSVVKYTAPNAPATKVFGIYNEVSNRIYYVSDPRRDEYIAKPLETWDARGGDCDDFSILLASMYEAVGMDAKIVEVYNIGQGHVFVIIKIEQELDSFLKLYKKMLENYTPYFSEKPINFIVFGETQRECESLESSLESGENAESFYLVVESTTGDYAGSKDAFEGYENVKFVEIGE